MRKHLALILITLLPLAAVSCQKDEGKQEQPKTQGAPVLNSMDLAVSATDVLCFTDWDKNGQFIIKCGVNISTSEAGLSDREVKTALGNEVLLCDLKPSTQYYIQAYATNSKGTTKSEIKAVTTKSAREKKAVDLGLSVKWADMNLGARAPEDFGFYYFWGDTQGHSGDIADGFNFLYGEYKYFPDKATGPNKFGITKYCNIEEYGLDGFTDTLESLEDSDDAAIAEWGGNWRMPGKAEWKELVDNCTWKKVNHEGLNGYEVKGSNGNSIFLPFSGSRSDIRFMAAGTFGYYWSSTLCVELCTDGECIAIGSTSVSLQNERRDRGFTIRAVCAD